VKIILGKNLNIPTTQLTGKSHSVIRINNDDNISHNESRQSRNLPNELYETPQYTIYRKRAII
ncbi:4683_t:CDS:2, partial [Dentiscutata heterogama]